MISDVAARGGSGGNGFPPELAWVPTAIIVVVVILAVFQIVRSVRRGRATHATQALAGELLNTGQRTIGRVISARTIHRRGLWPVEWTFQFQDAFGTEHEVTHKEVFLQKPVPEAGMSVSVIYDPRYPSDPKRTLASLKDTRNPNGYVRIKF